MRVLTQHLHAKRFGPWDGPESWGTAGSWGGCVVAWGGSVGLQARRRGFIILNKSAAQNYKNSQAKNCKSTNPQMIRELSLANPIKS